MSGAAMNNTGGKTLLGNFVEEVSTHCAAVPTGKVEREKEVVRHRFLLVPNKHYICWFRLSRVQCSLVRTLMGQHREP